MALSDWDLDRQHGELGEGLVAKLLANPTIEVKTDRKAQATGNVYIELWQNPFRQGWRESGLCITKADVWAFVLNLDPVVAVFVNTDALKREVREVYGGRAPGQRKRQPHEPVPTKGVVMPVYRLLTLGGT